jgi:hypothetical protein
VYKKVEVKGKGGGGKVYKVHVMGNPQCIWAIKKVKLEIGNEELRESVFNEIELLVCMCVYMFVCMYMPPVGYQESQAGDLQ